MHEVRFGCSGTKERCLSEEDSESAISNDAAANDVPLQYAGASGWGATEDSRFERNFSRVY